ncbi:signal recognition particle-docking protein FtsY [Fonticella tunisiensis]|uniref:Signal recognition particle receptor FtsY n=1 Tax=Fonticella tunisiensis TaxID=1096341 RepID=A0A4R7KTW8_9CLOT|nr:signal recognition particle-docking protein FtsY [Fonticella tunisiensis]TDT61603.1 fused signal recognition particle receptor [Fonticella tunisiensis]
MGWFDKLKEGLTKTRNNITEKVEQLLSLTKTIDDELYEELEEILIMADVGVNTTNKIIDLLRKRIKEKKVSDAGQVKEHLKDILSEIMGGNAQNVLPESTPAVYMIVGVNGVGKTTSIGKMANYLKGKGYRIMLAAGDTFRAAAIDQLEVWGNRAGVDVIKHKEGADPAAVIYDAIQSAKARHVDVLICDTAGRLHNKKNLMEELRKINRVVEREYPEAYKQTFLVLDATTGQNALIQAKQFIGVASVNGIILTKLDGTAKGGVVVAINDELSIPVKMIGVGEGMEDLQEFDPKAFVDALF